MNNSSSYLVPPFKSLNLHNFFNAKIFSSKFLPPRIYT